MSSDAIANPDPVIASNLAYSVLFAYGQAAVPPGFKSITQIFSCEPVSIIHPDTYTPVPFGYSLTNGSINVIALRGTVAKYWFEDFTDILDWEITMPCTLPPSGGKSYGDVNAWLYTFFTVSGQDSNGNNVPSLAASITAAIAALPNKNLPLFFTAHSLGGPMATLAVLNCVASGSYPLRPALYSFASLHVGMYNFATAFRSNVPTAYRFANMCDFVPSLVGASADNAGYVHVGLPCLFVWQTWGDWHNHNMRDVYYATVHDHWSVIGYSEPNYPAPLVGSSVGASPTAVASV
jgi:hypothetical protein